MLNIYVRHTHRCLNGEEAEAGKPKRPGLLAKGLSKEALAGYKYCQCPKYYSGTHQGVWHSRTSLKVNTWEEAKRALAKIEEGDLSEAGTKVEEAIAHWLDEVALANPPVAESTMTQWKINTSKLLAFCERQKIRYVQHLTPALINKWRAEWAHEQTHRSPFPGIKPNTASGRITVLKLFFKFVRRMRWIKEDPMLLIKIPKRSQDEEHHQTMPLDEEGDTNYRALLEAIPKYFARPVRRLLGAMATHPENLAALTELMYETGLRVSDATMFDLDTVEIDRDGWGAYTTRQIKNSRMVTVGIPPDLMKRIHGLQRLSPRYVFFAGKSSLSDFCRSQVWAYLRTIGAEIGIEGMRPHRLRDSFAVNRLNEGMLMQDVSKLLGHSSVTITERYYNPFVKSRKDALLAKRKAAQGTVSTSNVVPIKKRRAG